MRILVFDTPEGAADKLTSEILRSLERKPDLVLGLATGSTPLGIYSRLVRAHQEAGVDFSRVRTFNLDEYLGLPADHRQSYRHFMDAHLFQGLNIRPGNIYFPPTDPPDLGTKCRKYEETIREIGVDIQILGIGSNGHIGFNEPTSSLASNTRIKTLTQKTLDDNSRFYGPDEVQPQMAATMGIGTILSARRICLQAFGEKKAQALQASVEGPVSSFWPGSALQLHDDVRLYLDADSASLLSMLDYYRRTQKNEEELDRRGDL